MMARGRSAGVLLYRRAHGSLEVLLVHPGGPFWAKRDLGAWTIPKGAIETGEEPLAAARREFGEETGIVAPPGPAHPLGEVKQRGGKIIVAFAIEGSLDADAVRSNMVDIEWPPRSGRRISVPEVDRAAWYGLAEASEKMNEAQRAFLERLSNSLGLGNDALK